MTTAAAPSPWFRSPSFDFLLILGVPFLTWPLVTAANGTWGADLMRQLILLTATGHYFATFVRAYGDRDLFARFRVRLVIEKRPQISAGCAVRGFDLNDVRAEIGQPFRSPWGGHPASEFKNSQSA